MKMIKKLFFTFTLIVLFSASSVFAGSVDLTIGSGGESGTYYPIIEEMSNFCSSDSVTINHYIVNGKSVGGSVNNLRNLLNNKIMAGIIQADVAHLEKINNSAMNRVIALLPLHQEQVHVIVPLMTNVLVQEATKGIMGIGGKDAVYSLQENPLNNISDLSGHKIAAWGGSVVTSKVIKMMGDIGFEIVPVSDQAEGLKALNSGQVSAVVAVVGSPAKWVEDLPARQYKLLNVTKGTQDKLKNIYSISSVNYDNFGKTGQSIEALAVDSILFTRVYRTPKMVNALAELQQCVRKKIYEIQDTPGTHPAWQKINPSRDIKWDKVFKK